MCDDKYGIIVVSEQGECSLHETYGPYLEYTEICRYAACTTTEVVSCGVPALAKYRLAIAVDDEGLFTDKPVNQLASELYNVPGTPIVGTVMLGTFSAPDREDEPDVFALPLPIAKQLMEVLKEVPLCQ